MPRDAKGNELYVGAQVLIRATVRAHNDKQDGANIALDTDVELAPGMKVGISLNSKQCELALPPSPVMEKPMQENPVASGANDPKPKPPTPTPAPSPSPTPKTPEKPK